MGPQQQSGVLKGNRVIPKASGGQRKNRSCFFWQGSPTSCAQHWTCRGATSNMLSSASSVCLPANVSRSTEQIPAVYMLKICRWPQPRPRIPNYPIVLANEAAQYLSARNLQVPLIFPTVWCLVLTAGKRLVNRRAHLQF